ncbi:hypothetical protein L6R50_23100 [Myxococcota bacterium]|nr:hypothetical protein [Myxococcota bacterium]
MASDPSPRSGACPRRPRLPAALALALGLALGAAPRPAAAADPLRWEYRVERVEWVTKQPVVGPAQFLGAPQLEIRLNAAGAAGWELVETISVPDGGMLAVFKRPTARPPAAAMTPVPAPAPPSPAHPWAGEVSVAGPELLRRLQAGEGPVQIVDLRSASAFAAGHVYGALSVPFGDLERGRDALARDKALVLIDGGDGAAAGAANFLRNLGYAPVLVLDGGIARWPGALVPGDR